MYGEFVGADACIRPHINGTYPRGQAHFRHNYLKHRTMRRHQKYNLKLLKFAIDAQKSEDCRSRILTIKNGSNPVFEPNILAGVEGLEPSRTVLETAALPTELYPYVLNSQH